MTETTEMTEEQILKFWEDKEIYQKSKKKNQKGKKFYMMDGPPYATGHIHMGTALNKISKDVAMRAQRLQGKNVLDKPGYDTHGVPIEFKVEKEIGSKSKQDIEKYGVKKFIEKCKEYATKFIGVMGPEFRNLGVWMDFENPYLTLDQGYVETIWDTLKEADKQDLLYLGKYPVHVCPRCETAVSFNEIEYAKQKDTSVFVKFKLKEKDNTFLIIWTTTPWTLPANTGVMINPNVDYQQVELSSGENWIIAKDLVPKIMGELEMGFTVKEEFSGKEMVGWTYENPLSKHLKLKTKDAYRVIPSARYVTTEDGTGLVHCAPGHGKEDYEVGKEAGIDAPCPVNIGGLLTEETGKYAGKKARVVDAEIMEDLEADNALIHKLEYTHDYPLCWRCKSSLLMISQPQWFLKISDIQKNLLKENKKTKWIPKWMELRMKAWLEGISDWPISRERYWGTPLPIWTCNKCDKRKVIGSVKELEKLAKKDVKEVHKPEIDEVTFKCSCGGKMSRVGGVLDVWFDSGVSSWAALDYMNDKALFNEFWPADLNLEGKDQVRGWWNSQFILSQIKFGRKPFENIMVHGMILDMSKKKMSKSEGNVTAPSDIIKEHSRDFLRYYLAKISKGEDFSLQERDFKEIKKTFMMISNVSRFVKQIEGGKQKEAIEDKWITSRFNQTIKEVTESYNKFNFPEAIKSLDNFLINDLSRTYIQIIRERANETKKLLEEILVGTIKLFAPIIPFTTEKIWQELNQEEESIHLSLLPKANTRRIDEGLEAQFKLASEIMERTLRERDKQQLGLKWPLPKLTIFTKSNFHLEQFEEILKSQLNIKEIKIDKAKETELEIKLDTKLTPELKAEGYARELSRKIQAARKKAGLVVTDRIDLQIKVPEEILKLISKHNQLEFIEQRVGAKNSEATSIETGDKESEFEEEFKIKGHQFKILFNKL
ncbi:isoleucine--tRNA ligase [archaeon]|jgi:isoleucyl-tRNA synthetase|nr:isoleucine--tRNA ligase [archaeon]MBT3577731.1 isoleucine--tRNA ligase [archaeon]MBT6820738.1 isoleucine--tRNA ligase [archaeon]MBT7025878.1 isoleucine--tRNA ligase [archaeon]MBT7239220.1 isoleucine--tRNA ligase [archaeon]